MGRKVKNIVSYIFVLSFLSIFILHLNVFANSLSATSIEINSSGSSEYLVEDTITSTSTSSNNSVTESNTSKVLDVVNPDESNKITTSISQATTIVKTLEKSVTANISSSSSLSNTTTGSKTSADISTTSFINSSTKASSSNGITTSLNLSSSSSIISENLISKSSTSTNNTILDIIKTDNSSTNSISQGKSLVQFASSSFTISSHLSSTVFTNLHSTTSGANSSIAVSSTGSVISNIVKDSISNSSTYETSSSRSMENIANVDNNLVVQSTSNISSSNSEDQSKNLNEEYLQNTSISTSTIEDSTSTNSITSTEPTKSQTAVESVVSFIQTTSQNSQSVPLVLSASDVYQLPPSSILKKTSASVASRQYTASSPVVSYVFSQSTSQLAVDSTVSKIIEIDKESEFDSVSKKDKIPFENSFQFTTVQTAPTGYLAYVDFALNTKYGAKDSSPIVNIVSENFNAVVTMDRRGTVLTILLATILLACFALYFVSSRRWYREDDVALD